MLVAGSVTPAVPAAAAPDDSKYTPETCETFVSAPPPAEAWQMDRLRIPELHRIATGKGVTIAVIDTGVFLGYSDYMNGVDFTWRNFTGTDRAREGRVDCAHGSFVVSLIAAQPGADPDHEFSGIAPDASIVALRALQVSSSKPDDPEPLGPVIDAIDEAIRMKVDIISISQQGTNSDAYAAAVKKAQDAGILVVAAAGNNGAAGKTYPAAYPGVMAVGMTTPADVADEKSQYGGGMQISVAAPGSGVVGLYPLCKPGSSGCSHDAGPAAYGSDVGTSFATPLVAGAAALVMERYPELSAQEVKQLLERTADDPVGGVPDEKLGYGIINPYRALMGPRPPESSGGGTGEERSDVHIPPVSNEVDHTQRNTALAVAGISLGIVTVAGVVAAALPAGRRRGWRPPDRD